MGWHHFTKTTSRSSQANANGLFKPTNVPDDILADIYIITVGTVENKTKKPDIEHIRKAVLIIAKLKMISLF